MLKGVKTPKRSAYAINAACVAYLVPWHTNDKQTQQREYTENAFSRNTNLGLHQTCSVERNGTHHLDRMKVRYSILDFPANRRLTANGGVGLAAEPVCSQQLFCPAMSRSQSPEAVASVSLIV